MKKFFLLVFVSFINFFALNGQNIADRIKSNSGSLSFLPSNLKANDLKPSDVPSKLVLKQMGFSDEEIAEAMDYKYSRGKYNKKNFDLSDTLSNNDKLNLFFEDSLSIDSTIFPKAKIFGQDIFKSQIQ